MLLAARAVRPAAMPASSSTVDGAPHGGNFARRVSGEELSRHGRSPSSTAAPAAVDAVVTTVAAPAEPLPAGGDGFTIERTYYTLDGERGQRQRGQRRTSASWWCSRSSELNDWPSRIARHRPAAGRLRDRQSRPGRQRRAVAISTGWAKTEAGASGVPRRPLRRRLRPRRRRQPRVTLAYVVRAVTPGIYAHPAARWRTCTGRSSPRAPRPA